MRTFYSVGFSMGLALGLAGCSSSAMKKPDSAPGQASTPAPAASAAPSSVPQGSVAAKSSAELDERIIVCVSGSDKRTISVTRKGDGCVTHYGKASETSEVAKSEVGTDYCAKVREQIEKNLRASGFSCD